MRAPPKLPRDTPPCSSPNSVERRLEISAGHNTKLCDVTVGAVNHPQSNLADFYRELGDIFGIAMRVSNRWGGFKALRARWLDHLGAASRRPVILVDEAQEMTPMVLNELRLLASARFDSQSLLCVVLCGDARLLDKLRREELIPLGSRIRTRLATGVATREELLACLDHLLTTAGNAGLTLLFGIATKAQTSHCPRVTTPRCRPAAPGQ